MTFFSLAFCVGAGPTDRLEKLESNAQNETLQRKSAELHTFQGVAAREHLQANIFGIYFLHDLNNPVKSDYPNHVSDHTTPSECLKRRAVLKGNWRGRRRG